DRAATSRPSTGRESAGKRPGAFRTPGEERSRRDRQGLESARVCASRRLTPSRADTLVVEREDGVAGPNPSAFQHSAKHPAQPTQLLLQARTDFLHALARLAGDGDLQEGLADAEMPA